MEGPTGRRTFIMRGTDNRWYEFPLVDTTRTRNFWQPKVGLNYNVTQNINAYANFAHVERFVDLGVFYNYGRPNYAAPDEKSNQYEVGIGWTSDALKVKVNGYRMAWDNKVTRIRDVGMSGQPGYDYQGYISLQVGSAIFKGIEAEVHLDLAPVGAKNLEFVSAASFMSNRWTKVNDDVKKDLTGARRPFNTSAVGPDGKTFTMYFDQLENTPVAGGPQTMVYLGLEYDDGTLFGGINATEYAQQFVLDGGTYMATDGYFTGNLGVMNTFVSSYAQKLPPRSVFNFNLGARFKMGVLRGNASLQVLNAFDNQYLEDADRNGVYPGIGRALRFNLGIGI
jgi:outer membrane receptor protein involved in Fe transport